MIDAAQTRTNILVAACETIAEIGFDKVRMRNVAERAGVSTALLHYHFSNREKLFQEALRYTFETVGRDEYEAPAPADNPHAWRLARIIDSSLPMDEDTRRDGLLWQELWLRAARDKDSREFTHWLYAELRDWIRGVVAEGVAAGNFGPCDPAKVADLVLILTDGYSVHLAFGDPAFDLHAAETTIWRLVSAELGLSIPFPRRHPDESS